MIPRPEEVVLFRPVGSQELRLIEEAGFRAFPPRLPEQPIFYPVTNEGYARQIARDWNAKLNDDRIGYVTRFCVPAAFIGQFEKRVVGGREHEEYWVPAERLGDLNDNILGRIEVLAVYDGRSGVIEEVEPVRHGR